MIKLKELSASGFIEVHVLGEVTDADYKNVLVPELDKAIETGEPLRLLLIFADDVSYSLKAVLDDAELGLRHWAGFDRIAVVAGQDWILNTVRWFGWMMPCAVQTFGTDQEDDARRWLRESLGTIHQTDLGSGVLHLSLMGKLDPASYAEEEQDLDAFLNRTQTPRVLLDVREFEGWQSLSALPKHLSLVRRHYATWDKIAILGDRRWQKMAERLLGQIRGGETSFFSADQEAAAKAWLTS
jgi:hypothetical protein